MSDEQAFAALSRRACPPVGEALFAVAASWRPVNWAELDAKLDHLARPLFAAGPGGRERAGALAELLVANFRPDGKAVERLWLDEVLASRRGHPLLLAAVATELGRRSGWQIMVCSSPEGWYAGLLDDGVLWLVDPPARRAARARPRPCAATAPTRSRSSCSPASPSASPARATKALRPRACATGLDVLRALGTSAQPVVAARMTRVSMSVPSSRRRIEMCSSLPCMSASSSREIGYG